MKRFHPDEFMTSDDLPIQSVASISLSSLTHCSSSRRVIQTAEIRRLAATLQMEVEVLGKQLDDMRRRCERVSVLEPPGAAVGLREDVDRLDAIMHAKASQARCAISS